MSTHEPNVVTVIADAERIQRELHILTSRKVLLRFRPDGTSECDSEEDLREAAVIFWRSVVADPYGGVIIWTLTTKPNKPAGFFIDRNGTIECFGGYEPDASTRHALETIARLRPVVSDP